MKIFLLHLGIQQDQKQFISLSFFYCLLFGIVLNFIPSLSFSQDCPSDITDVGTDGTYMLPAGPFSYRLFISVKGASGGDATGNSVSGGGGLTISNEFIVSGGSMISYYIGTDGSSSVSAGGGGGGSGVVLNSTTLLLAAGGGGGAANSSNANEVGQGSTNSLFGPLAPQTGGAGNRGGGGGSYLAPGGNGTFSTTGGSAASLTLSSLGGMGGVTVPVGGNGGSGFGGGGGSLGGGVGDTGGGGGGGYIGGDGGDASVGELGGKAGIGYLNSLLAIGLNGGSVGLDGVPNGPGSITIQCLEVIPDFAVNKTWDSTTINAITGLPVSWFTIEICNNTADSLGDIQVSDTIVYPSSTCDGNVGIIPIGSPRLVPASSVSSGFLDASFSGGLPANSCDTFVVSFEYPPLGTATENSAIAEATLYPAVPMGGDTISVYDTSTVDFYVPFLGVSKQVTDVVCIDELDTMEVTFEVTVENLGTDTFPDYTVYDSLPTPGLLSPAINPFSEFVSAPIFPGQSATRTYTARYNASQALDAMNLPVCNSAIVSATGLHSSFMVSDTSNNQIIDPDEDCNPANNSLCTVFELPKISLTKSIDTVYVFGECMDSVAIEFCFIVQNVGNIDLFELRIIDSTLSEANNFYLDTALSLDFTPDANRAFLQYDFGEPGLAPGASVGFCGTYQVDPLNIQVGFKNSAFVEVFDTLIDIDLGPFEIIIASDTSDAGTDPLTTNPGYPGDQGTYHDSTCVVAPNISIAKWVDSTALVIVPMDSVGNFDVWYKIKLVNTGNVDLEDVTLFDNLDDPNLLGSGYMAHMGQPEFTFTWPLLGAPTPNPDYDGVLEDSIFRLEDAVTIPVGDSIEMCMKLMVNPNATLPVPAPDTLNNQAIVSAVDAIYGFAVSDSSDNGMEVLSDNGEGGCNDVTPLNLADINISKQILSVQPYNQALFPGDVAAEFQLLIKNKGNVPLYDIMVVDSIQTLLGTVFKEVIDGPTIQSPPQIINGSATNVMPAQNPPTIMSFPKLIDGTAEIDTLNRDEFIDIRYTLRLDPNAMTAPYYLGLMNQATTMAGSMVGTTMDMSDTGPDPENSNAGEEGDTGAEDDATLVTLPSINVAKEISKVRKPSSGILGNFEAIFTINVENTGNTSLDSVFLYEDFGTQYGPYFVKKVSLQYLFDDATVAPPINGAYTGFMPNHSLTVADGITVIEPGQTLSLELIIEIDPDAGGLLCDSLYNSIMAVARGNNDAGDPLLDALDLFMETNDSSDAGLIPEDFNPDNFADRGTADDPTIIPDCWKEQPTCNDLVSVSLGAECEIFLRPDMFLENSSQVCEDLCFWQIISIVDDYGRELENPIGSDQLGKMLTVSLWNIVDMNPCWSKARIEYKYPPQVDCKVDTISCFEELPDLDIITQNACGYPVKFEILYEQWDDFDDCHDPEPGEFIGRYIRKVKSSDPWNNNRTCMDTIYVMKETMDSIVCPSDIEIECDDLNTDCAELISSNGVKKYYAPYPTGSDVNTPDDNDADNDNAEESYGVPYIKSLKENVGHLPLYQDDDCDGQRDEYLNKCTIYADYEDWIIPSCGHSYKIRREWKIVDWCAGRDTICSQYIKVNDTEAPQFEKPTPNRNKEFSTNAHDCKAAVYLDVPDTEDCWDESAYKLTYELVYHDPTHPGKKVALSGDATNESTIHFYLPASYDAYEIKWTASDACWNNDFRTERFYVIDNTPPTPVCDEHTVATVVSIDPGDCWARIFAKDLDDGSHDNCCGELHFAVATMADIEHYTDSIKGYYEECLGQHYKHYEYEINHIIEAYIQCFVFADYVDLSHSDDQTLVMRVYEACGLKPYDPHVFHGSKHQWFCYQQHDVYALWYTSHYQEFSKYENPAPDLVCQTYGGNYTIGLDWGCYPGTIRSQNGGPHGPTDIECLDEVAPCFDECCLACPLEVPEIERGYGLECAFDEAGLSEGQFDYQVLRELYCSRNHFYTSYSECMVEVTIDDKEAPVCTPAPDRYVTCDGIPLDEDVWQGKNDDHLAGDHYDLLRAHGVCDGPGMAPSPYDDPWIEQDDADSGFPGYNCADGYYGGPSNDDYNTYGSKSRCYPDIWEGEGTWNASPDGGYQKNWRPIYCENWLYLDAYDDCDYERYDPYQLFEEPDYEDNCQDPVLTWVGDHEELNECGEGYIKRTWMVEDWAGNQTYCHQKVYVYCRSDFEIKFPVDEIVNCDDETDLEPGEGTATGWPVVEDAECELIAITHHDQIFNDASDACYKILRTWTVIDWCKFNPDAVYHKPDVIIDDRVVASDEAGSDRDCIYRYLKDNGDGYMTYLQVIKIIDTEAPEFVDCATEDIVYDVLACEAEVTETIEATDNCDDVQYTWRLNGQTGHGNSVTMTLPLGEYELTWIAHDQCQNADTCVETVVVNNIKPPSPICKGIVTVLMPTDPPMVTIWAADIVEKVEDDCTLEEDIIVTFDPENEDSSFLNMTCDDFSAGNNTVIVYFIDGDDNVEQCAVTVILQGSAGNESPCGINQGAAAIEGSIATESTEPVEFVEIELMLGEHMLSPFVTGVDGKFSFNAVPINNGYAVVPERNDDYNNGVSTFDLVLIQKHILGIEPLDSPYKVIAADINNSESVSAIDLVELRKLILNYYSELPQNSSWRFVDGTHEFADIQNPWGYPEKVEIENLSSNEVADFVAIKVGDVNQSSVPHSLLGSVIRSNEGDLAFEIEDRAVNAGEIVSVQIRSNNFNDVLGYQFTLATGGMEVTEVIPGVLNVTESNFGFQNMGEGQVTTSWNEAEGVKASAEEVLFTLVMKSKVGGQLSDLLSANSRYTAAEAYNTTTPNLGVALNFVTDGISTADFDLYQNSPNPFGKETVIGFVLPKNMSAELKIYDVTGKTLKLFSGDYVKGYNSVMVNRNEIQGSGILYYTLETQDYTATKKMVLID